ncbi:MAG: hypothetical protein M1836_005503 [Candelina mexicana]|nr:MAG: hypothetical protein M1836_005503 [Candelina mexicana]
MNLTPTIIIVSLLVFFIILALVILIRNGIVRRTRQQQQKSALRGVNVMPVRMLTVREGRVVPNTEVITPTSINKKSWFERSSWLSGQTTRVNSEMIDHRNSESQRIKEILVNDRMSHSEKSGRRTPKLKHVFPFERQRMSTNLHEAAERGEMAKVGNVDRLAIPIKPFLDPPPASVMPSIDERSSRWGQSISTETASLSPTEKPDPPPLPFQTPFSVERIGRASKPSSRPESADVQSMSPIAQGNASSVDDYAWHHPGTRISISKLSRKLSAADPEYSVARQLIARRKAATPPTSYWSVAEQQDFPKLVAHFGTSWTEIASWMPAKTHIMVRNYFNRLVCQGRTELAEAAKLADAKRERGEGRGPLPEISCLDTTANDASQSKPERRRSQRLFTKSRPSSARNSAFPPSESIPELPRVPPNAAMAPTSGPSSKRNSQDTQGTNLGRSASVRPKSSSSAPKQLRRSNSQHSVSTYDSDQFQEFKHYFGPTAYNLHTPGNRPSMVSTNSISTLASIDSIIQPTARRKEKALPPLPILHKGTLVRKDSGRIMKLSGTGEDLRKEKAKVRAGNGEEWKPSLRKDVKSIGSARGVQEGLKGSGKAF